MIPKKRQPAHPGEILSRVYLKDMAIYRWPVKLIKVGT
jgi:plasmid maintenance system antidote protein VapI